MLRVVESKALSTSCAAETAAHGHHALHLLGIRALVLLFDLQLRQLLADLGENLKDTLLSGPRGHYNLWDTAKTPRIASTASACSAHEASRVYARRRRSAAD